MTMTTPTETPRTDACPHCGDDHPSQHPWGFCCMEGHMKQLEAEVERLKDLCNWAETLLCNAEPPKHSTEEEWSQLVTKFRSELHPIQTK